MSFKEVFRRFEGAIIVILLLFIFSLYYLRIYNLLIDLLAVAIALLLSVNSLFNMKSNKKYEFHHLIIANAFLVIAVVHFMRFLFEVIS